MRYKVLERRFLKLSFKWSPPLSHWRTFPIAPIPHDMVNGLNAAEMDFNIRIYHRLGPDNYPAKKW